MDFRGWLAIRTPAGAPTAGRAGTRHPLAHPACPRSARLWPRPARRTRRRRGSAAAVHAAYLVDVEGVSPRRLVTSDLFDFGTDRSARHHVRDGRLTAADLGVWPWAVIDGKPLPRNWWADRDFALALQEWSIGELHWLAGHDDHFAPTPELVEA